MSQQTDQAISNDLQQFIRPHLESAKISLNAGRQRLTPMRDAYGQDYSKELKSIDDDFEHLIKVIEEVEAELFIAQKPESTPEPEPEPTPEPEPIEPTQPTQPDVDVDDEDDKVDVPADAGENDDVEPAKPADPIKPVDELDPVEPVEPDTEEDDKPLEPQQPVSDDDGLPPPLGDQPVPDVSDQDKPLPADDNLPAGVTRVDKLL